MLEGNLSEHTEPRRHVRDSNFEIGTPLELRYSSVPEELYVSVFSILALPQCDVTAVAKRSRLLLNGRPLL